MDRTTAKNDGQAGIDVLPKLIEQLKESICRLDSMSVSIANEGLPAMIADEAHRSQYGFKARRDKNDPSKISYGFARNIRDGLPNASFIGFTGTPIELDDKNTQAVFGDYVSVYDIQRAVHDKATVPSCGSVARSAGVPVVHFV